MCFSQRFHSEIACVHLYMYMKKEKDGTCRTRNQTTWTYSSRTYSHTPLKRISRTDLKARKKNLISQISCVNKTLRASVHMRS